MRLAAYLAEAAIGVLALPAAWLLRLRPGGRGKRRPKVVVQGWYGSETAGDVAILGQVLREWEAALAGARLMVASFEPRITRRTLAELGRQDLPVLETGAASAWHQATAACTVFGGGPLMESRSMPFWALRALLARLAGGKVVVHGCGIGPLRSRRGRAWVGWILRLSNRVLLRDRRSAELYPRLLERRPASVSFDPAYDYVRARRPAAPAAAAAEPVLALFLRLPPPVFLHSHDRARAGFLPLVAAALDRLAEERGARFVGLVMHGDFPESDDAGVYRALAGLLEQPRRLIVPEGYQSFARILSVLAAASAALTVRFHGMIFSLALDKPFLAIDYTVPRGKTRAAAEVVGAAERVIAWQDLGPQTLAHRLDALLDEAAAGGDGAAPAGDGFARERIAVLRQLMSPAAGSGRPRP